MPDDREQTTKDRVENALRAAFMRAHPGASGMSSAAVAAINALAWSAADAPLPDIGLRMWARVLESAALALRNGTDL